MAKVTIGGDRLGSGKKMQTSLNNYGRSTHNLSQSFKSTLAPGVLYPFLKIPAVNGDTFDINLESILRTLPTKAPIFGSFKFQLDVFQVPIRLYQGILHNNPINIGLKMSQVLLPTMNFPGSKLLDTFYTRDTGTNSLAKYMGLSGTGIWKSADFPNQTHWTRELQCVPILAYYDIFKNYYANKQETNAYVITPDNPNVVTIPISASLWINNGYNSYTYQTTANDINGSTILEKEGVTYTTGYLSIFLFNQYRYRDGASGLDINKVQLNFNDAQTYSLQDLYENDIANWTINKIPSQSEMSQNAEVWEIIIDVEKLVEDMGDAISTIEITTTETSGNKPIKLTSFPLENIDKIREKILNYSVLGSAMPIASQEAGQQNGTTILPYSTITATNTNGVPYNAFPMNGLIVKTYQSDLFNNWLQTEWIDGDNGISAVTAISTAEGSFTIDQLNLAQKIYNMLNRIAISGGTYQDWQKAVYTNNVIMHAETPVWCGGMSSEVVFEEVISTADTEESALGSLAGKGRLAGKHGGKMHIKVNEPSYIIGILSITPRIDYTQGNDWDITDLHSIDDLHKPALDGIGFQDLIVEQMAWWDTQLDDLAEYGVKQRNAAGKVPAWINYMTAVDKAYGDFVNTEKLGYMILARNYERKTTDDSVKDITTYIDPSKFNYAFAYSDLQAQNFWTQVYCHISARRVMSAKIIPNI